MENTQRCLDMLSFKSEDSEFEAENGGIQRETDIWARTLVTWTRKTGECILYIYIYIFDIYIYDVFVYACMYVCTVCMYVCMHACMHVCMYCMYVCLSVCVYVCM